METITISSQQNTVYYLDNVGAAVIPSGTGNCQLSIVRNACAILDSFSDAKIKEIFVKFRNTCGTPLLLLDVNRYLCEKVENIFTESQIVFRQDYVSTNSSDMTIYVVRVPSTLIGKY